MLENKRIEGSGATPLPPSKYAKASDSTPLPAQPSDTSRIPLTGRILPLEAPASKTENEASTARILDEWVHTPPKEEYQARNFIRNKILNFLNSPTETMLDLRDMLFMGKLSISSLPDVFTDPRFSKLELIDIRWHKLTHLPESFSCLTNCKIAFLNGNQIASLPESFGHLTNLQELFLNDNKLTSLPKSFNHLTNLQLLKLCNNWLTPDLKIHLPKLTDLDLSCNQLKAPPDVSLSKNLKKLNLSGNLLTSSPDISELQHLTVVYLSFNPTLTSFPDSILELPSDCRLEIAGCGLSPLALEELLEKAKLRRAQNDGRGPLIFYSTANLRWL